MPKRKDPRARRKNGAAPKGDILYRQLWRLVDGAVADAFSIHPDYLTDKGHHSARTSITKRVTGALHGYATQVAKGGSGLSPAAEKASSMETLAAEG